MKNRLEFKGGRLKCLVINNKNTIQLFILK